MATKTKSGYSLYEISCQVMPYASKSLPLPESHESDPDYQSMRALWGIILHERRNSTARLTAIREYYDRVIGKAKDGENDGESETYDLLKLTPDERETFLALVAKMKGGLEDDSEAGE
jgi:hypothetical protein